MFWSPALDRPQIWRTLLGISVVAAVWIVVTFGVVVGLPTLVGHPGWSRASGDTWPSAALFFASFVGFHAGLALVLPLLHKRRYRTLFGPQRRLIGAHFWRGTAVTLAIAAALYLLLAVEHRVLPEGIPPNVRQNMPLSAWLPGLAPALVLIFLQTLAEEAVFRGYLLQQLRARFRSVWIWAVLPSALFGLLHFDSATFGTVNAAAYVLNATVMGTIAALVTMRTGNLAAAAGLHFGNNAALTVFGLEGHLDGFSLFTLEMDLTSGYTTYSILMQTAAVALAFLAWRRWMAVHRPIA